MDKNTFLFLVLIIPMILCILGYFLGKSEGIQETIKEYKERSYRDALNIFFAWKKEIGGVSLKGVGQHYEKWIMDKINKSSNPPPGVDSNLEYKPSREYMKKR